MTVGESWYGCIGVCVCECRWVPDAEFTCGRVGKCEYGWVLESADVGVLVGTGGCSW